jgi:hypothetical protein
LLAVWVSQGTRAEAVHDVLEVIDLRLKSLYRRLGVSGRFGVVREPGGG